MTLQAPSRLPLDMAVSKATARPGWELVRGARVAGGGREEPPAGKASAPSYHHCSTCNPKVLPNSPASGGFWLAWLPVRFIFPFSH